MLNTNSTNWPANLRTGGRRAHAPSRRYPLRASPTTSGCAWRTSPNRWSPGRWLPWRGLRPPPWALWKCHLPRPGRRPPRRCSWSCPAPTAPGCPSTVPRRPCHLKQSCGPFWRAADAATHPPKPHFSRHAPRGFSQRDRWPRGRVSAGAGREPARGRRLCLPQPRRHGAQAVALRRAGLLALYETVVARPFPLVAHNRRRTGAPVRTGIDHSAVEWRPRARPNGSGLATRGLGWGQMRLVGPGQPRRGIGKHLGAVFLEGHEIIEDIDTRIDAGGDQAGEHTGDRGAVVGLVEQRVLTLPDKQLQRPLHHVVVQWRASHR